MSEIQHHNPDQEEQRQIEEKEVKRIPVRDPERRVSVYGKGVRKRYRGVVFEDIPLSFFRCPPDEEHFEDYRTLAEAELLTEAEADALIAWLLSKWEGVVNLTKEYHDAFSEKVYPCCAVPAGGDYDFWPLDEELGYDLPFKVWGLVDYGSSQVNQEEKEKAHAVLFWGPRL